MRCLEINAHFAAAGKFDAGSSGSVVKQGGYCVRHALGWIVVVIVHVDDDVAVRLFVHHVSLFAKRNLFVQTVVFDAWVLRHEVFNWVGSVINYDPLHAITGIRLVVEALQHGSNERAAVERRRTHADKWLHWIVRDI